MKRATITALAIVLLCAAAPGQPAYARGGGTPPIAAPQKPAQDCKKEKAKLEHKARQLNRDRIRLEDEIDALETTIRKRVINVVTEERRVRRKRRELKQVEKNLNKTERKAFWLPC